VSNAADTRERILETAWPLVRERGVSAVTVADIAAAAGVSRQLVYVHFASRAGLLVALARHHDERSGFRGRALATRELPPVAALEALLRAWCEYVPDILPVAQALEAAAIAGEEGATAWRDRMGELHDALAVAMRRLDEEGALAPGWTAATAADWAWARIQPGSWRALVSERGWAPADYVGRTVGSIVAEVVTATFMSRSPNV
jgi:AcrR family transcriptional regulator